MPRRSRFVDTASKAPSWQALHKVADAAYPALARLWTTVFAEVRDAVTQDAMRDALAQGNLAAVQALLVRVWPQVGIGSARVPLLKLLQQAVAQGAAAVTPALRATLDVGVSVRFGVISQESLVWIARYGGQEIREIGQGTMDGVRTILRRQFTEGRGLTDVMADLEAQVGLTARQVRTLETLRTTLGEAGVSPGEITRQVQVAAQRALLTRVEAIARTESLAAANNGQQARWQEAVDKGLLDVDRFKRFWILTPDSRLCNICRQIPGLNRDGVGLNQPFQTPLGPVMTPPGHVQCRCAVNGRVVQ